MADQSEVASVALPEPPRKKRQLLPPVNHLTDETYFTWATCLCEMLEMARGDDSMKYHKELDAFMRALGIPEHVLSAESDDSTDEGEEEEDEEEESCEESDAA